MSLKYRLLMSMLLASILVSLPIFQAYGATPMIKINEVMLNPAKGDLDNQWIELCYKGPDLLNLGGWLIKSTNLGKTFMVPGGFVIQPNDYLVIPFPNVMFAHQNESVVLLTSGFVEVDRTPQLTDTFHDGRTWQRFPDCSSTWDFRNTTMGLTNGFPQAKPNFTLSAPEFVDAKGNMAGAFNSGQMAGIRSEIANLSNEEKTFTYILQIKNEQGFTVFISMVEDLTVPPGATVHPVAFWFAGDKGSFQIDVSVWRSLAIPESLAPQQSGVLRIAG